MEYIPYTSPDIRILVLTSLHNTVNQIFTFTQIRILLTFWTLPLKSSFIHNFKHS